MFESHDPALPGQMNHKRNTGRLGRRVLFKLERDSLLHIIVNRGRVRYGLRTGKLFADFFQMLPVEIQVPITR